jgi:hypothetical protein
MKSWWKWFLPGYLLAAPGTAVGIILMLWYRPKCYYSSGCIEAVSSRTLIGGPWVGAQTFGNVIFYRDENMRKLNRLRIHERVHAWQAMVMSWPIFMLLYGAHFLVLLATVDGTWVDAYRQIWAERMAYSRESRAGAWGDE